MLTQDFHHVFDQNCIIQLNYSSLQNLVYDIFCLFSKLTPFLNNLFPIKVLKMNQSL